MRRVPSFLLRSPTGPRRPGRLPSPPARSWRRLVRGSGRSCSGDPGQVLPLTALLIAAGLGVVVLLAQLGGVVLDRSRAKASADAAALAAVLGGPDAARTVAAANGAVLEAVTVAGDGVVEVTVRWGRARATSRAEPDPRPLGRVACNGRAGWCLLHLPL